MEIRCRPASVTCDHPLVRIITNPFQELNGESTSVVEVAPDLDGAALGQRRPRVLDYVVGLVPEPDDAEFASVANLC